MIDFDLYDWLIGVGLLFLLLPALWWRKRSLSYLLFFSLFWVYLLAVVQVVVFPFVISTNYGVSTFTPNVNLIPFNFGSCSLLPGSCVRSILENILLTLPFGFGIDLLTRFRPRNVLLLSIGLGLALELTQLAISLAFRSGFRAVDVNDAALNAIGVLIGYGLFRISSWAYLKATARFSVEHQRPVAENSEVVSQMQSHAKT